MLHPAGTVLRLVCVLFKMTFAQKTRKTKNLQATKKRGQKTGHQQKNEEAYKQLRLSTMKTAFTLALAVGVASASNLRTVAGGDIKFLRANPGATGMSSGEGDEFPPCAQTCQGKPISCDMALEWMGYEGCGEHCDQKLKDQLLSAMGCTDMVAGLPANVEGGTNNYANNYATGAATDGTMKDCGPYGPENTFTCGKTCNMLCMDESGGGTMDGMNADSTMTGAATDGTMNGCGPFGPENTFTCGPTCNMKCIEEVVV